MTAKKKASPASTDAHPSGTLRTELMESPAETPAEPEQDADRRRHPRYRLSLPVTLRKDGALMSSMSVEISQSGMSIAIVAHLNTGETVDKASAVVRRQGNFCGFEFVRLMEAQIVPHLAANQARNANRYKTRVSDPGFVLFAPLAIRHLLALRNEGSLPAEFLIGT